VPDLLTVHAEEVSERRALSRLHERLHHLGRVRARARVRVGVGAGVRVRARARVRVRVRVSFCTTSSAGA